MDTREQEVANPTTVIDARGLQCPMPLVRASQAMKQSHVGDVVKVMATDRGSVPDFQAWIRTQRDYVLLKQEQETGQDGKTVYIHFLKHGA